MRSTTLAGTVILVVCALGVAAWLLVFFWVVSGHKRVGGKNIPLASEDEWKDEKRKCGAWPSAKAVWTAADAFCSVARHVQNARLLAFHSIGIVAVASHAVVWLWALHAWLARNRLQIRARGSG